MAGNLVANYPYIVAVLLFALGILMVLAERSLMKKILGLNIMQSGVFIIYIAMGNIRGGKAPIIDVASKVDVEFVNPLPSVLILTGIVVSVSVTALALSLVVKLHRFYGTQDMRKILSLEKKASSGEKAAK